MSYTQEGRGLSIDTPLGRDRLLLVEVTGREAISEPFHFTARTLSEDRALDRSALIGQPALLRLRMDGGEERLIHGVVSKLREGWTTRENLRHYTLDIVPWLWFLGLSRDCRVYQNLTVPEIVVGILKEFGIKDFDTGMLMGIYPPLEYSVQFEETYLAYISRLLETAGIFFFFRHEKSRHVLVLGDTNQAFALCAEAEQPYDPSLDGPLGRVRRWEREFPMASAHWAGGDYNPMTPTTSLEVHSANALGTLAHKDLEKLTHFEWQSGQRTHDEGEALALVRVQEQESALVIVEGESTCPSFTAGYRMSVAENPEGGHPSFLLTHVEHDARDYSHLSGEDQAGYTYANHFTAVPTTLSAFQGERHYRPARRTPKPRIHSIQTAVVVGPEGETISVDANGRVKIRFHWDRHSPAGGDTSCWVRVSQIWASKGYGAVHPPHVGDEVVVSFLDGDPDRPLVVGRVYNGAHPNPSVAQLLDLKTRAVSQDQGGNAFVTEGKDGQQKIALYSPQGNSCLVMGKYTGGPTPPPGARATSALHMAGAKTGLYAYTEGDEEKRVKGRADHRVDQDHTDSVGGSRTVLTEGDSDEETTGMKFERVKNGEIGIIGPYRIELTYATFLDVALVNRTEMSVLTKVEVNPGGVLEYNVKKWEFEGKKTIIGLEKEGFIAENIEYMAKHKVEAIEQSVTTVDAKFTGVNLDIDAVKKSVTAVETKLTSEINKVQTSVHQVDAAMDKRICEMGLATYEAIQEVKAPIVKIN